MMMIDYHAYGNHQIGVKEFPSFIRITLQGTVRRQLFSHALKTVGKIKRKYDISEDLFFALYGEKKAKILNLLLEGPQTATSLIKNSELSPSAAYHLLNTLRSQNRIKKEGRTYRLNKSEFHSVTLHELVKMEEEPDKRRKYGVSVRELELAFFLWERFSLVAPDDGGYGRTYSNWYTMADAVHRWRTGRTDLPVWALQGLIDLSGPETLTRKGAITQYHVPPGIPVKPYSHGEYRLPVHVDGTLDKIVVQLMQKMSKNHLYTFPKRKKWLFKALKERFGDFDTTTTRIPSAITEILKSYYGLKSLDRFSSCIPDAMKTRWAELNPVSKMEEVSSLVLHIISLSSRSNGGFEITSRSKSFLQDVSYLTSDLGLGALTVRKKLSRPQRIKPRSSRDTLAFSRNTRISSSGYGSP